MNSQRRHGEYKVPEGKLVVVDLELEGEQIARLELSGDFFLEPAEALDEIVAALEGAPMNSTEEELARRVEQRLQPGVELIGFSPLAVGIAIRRALE